METEYPRASALGPFFRYYAALLAEARAKFGKVSEALTVVRSALETVTEPGIGIFVPELYRLQGICLLRLNPDNWEEAMTSLQTAIDVAKQQNATLFQLKAAIDMANAASSIGLSNNGFQCLRDCYAGLSEEFDAPQRAQARELLSAQG
jgi:hypothetical protein